MQVGQVELTFQVATPWLQRASLNTFRTYLCVGQSVTRLIHKSQSLALLRKHFSLSSELSTTSSVGALWGGGGAPMD